MQAAIDQGALRLAGEGNSGCREGARIGQGIVAREGAPLCSR